jgi:hypothetical protein
MFAQESIDSGGKRFHDALHRGRECRRKGGLLSFYRTEIPQQRIFTILSLGVACTISGSGGSACKNVGGSEIVSKDFDGFGCVGRRRRNQAKK